MDHLNEPTTRLILSALAIQRSIHPRQGKGMCTLRWLIFTILVPISLAANIFEAKAQEESVFSGPQADEPLPLFEVQDLLSDDEKVIDPIGVAEGKPCMILFIHKLSRPAIGLTRALVSSAKELAEDAPAMAVIFLTSDPIETQEWAKRARNALPQGVLLGVSTDGIEGPGAYGLNREVSMTVLIGNKNKVTKNFALIQPSAQADTPKIITALASCLGVEVSDELQKRMKGDAAQRNSQSLRPGMVDDAELRKLLRPLLNKKAAKGNILEAAKRVELAAEKSPALKKRIGEICRRIIDAKRLENYGNEHAQEILSRWAKDFN